MAREFGSLNNMLMANNKAETPKVGDGATILGWTDRHPATVVYVSPSGKTIHLQEDDYKRTDDLGMTDSGQKYIFIPNPKAEIKVARLTPKGWKIVKGSRVLVGRREKYHDFSF